MTSLAKPARRSRILLVDDHPLVRSGLRDVIEREADLIVCGEAENHAEALAAVAATHPDLVIVDLKLKNSDGLELVADIHQHHPKSSIVIFSMHDELLYAERAIRAGAHGYVSKQQDADKLLHAIRTVLGGKIFCSDTVAQRMISRLSPPHASNRTFPPEVLSENELKVFELIGSGHSTSQISNVLNISPSTVETYRVRIKGKLALRDADELRKEAIRWNVAKAAD